MEGAIFKGSANIPLLAGRAEVLTFEAGFNHWPGFLLSATLIRSGKSKDISIPTSRSAISRKGLFSLRSPAKRTEEDAEEPGTGR